MENQEPELLMGGTPEVLHKCVFGVIRWVSGAMHDRVAFASESARECYTAARVLPIRCTTATFEELPEVCVCDRGQGKGKQMAFVGALERRKGLPDLLAAWQEAGLAVAGWQLAVAGAGPLADDLARTAAADPSIVPLGPISRREVHEVMARTAVVVLPSRREGRWREQIGLSIVEGLAHGCHVIATPDSGLSGWLSRHGHDVLPEDFTVADLVHALRRAADTRLSPATVHESLPPVDGRMAAEDWMYQ
jgi:glycosyltransferase involved in cell wall biosynthesis